MRPYEVSAGLSRRADEDIGPYGVSANLFGRAHGMRPYEVSAGLSRRADEDIGPYGVSANLFGRAHDMRPYGKTIPNS